MTTRGFRESNTNEPLVSEGTTFMVSPEPLVIYDDFTRSDETMVVEVGVRVERDMWFENMVAWLNCVQRSWA